MRLRFLSLSAAALCAVVFTAKGLTTAAAATPTHVTVYSPWSSGKLALGYVVARKGTGYCWTQSLSTDRPNAWRCFEGNDISDPCFSATPQSGDVACPESAFIKRVVVLRLTKPLPKSTDPTTKWLQSKGEPWSLRLSDGETCYFVTGATDAIGGERMNYECRGDTWVIGFPDRSSPVWTVRTIVWPNKRSVKPIGIKSAVF